MSDRKVAYTPIALKEGYGIAIVEEGVAGFSVDPNEPLFPTWDFADRRAGEKNTVLKISQRNVWEIIASSMTASHKANERWKQRGS